MSRKEEANRWLHNFIRDQIMTAPAEDSLQAMLKKAGVSSLNAAKASGSITGIFYPPNQIADARIVKLTKPQFTKLYTDQARQIYQAEISYAVAKEKGSPVLHAPFSVSKDEINRAYQNYQNDQGRKLLELQLSSPGINLQNNDKYDHHDHSHDADNDDVDVDADNCLVM